MNKQYYIKVKNPDHQNLIYSFLKSKGCIHTYFDESKRVSYFAFSKELFNEGRFYFGEECRNSKHYNVYSRTKVNSIEEMIDLFSKFQKDEVEIDGLLIERSNSGGVSIPVRGSFIYLTKDGVEKLNEFVKKEL